MIRTSLIICLGFTLTSLPTLAAADKAQDCETFASIAQQVADQRVSGADKPEAIEMVAGKYEDEQARFANTVVPLADWIYSLPEDQAAGDIETAYKTACLAS